MNLPFYINNYPESQSALTLDEDTSRHVVQVLRMKKGELLNLTDGMGNLLTGEIINEDKKGMYGQYKIKNPKSKTGQSSHHCHFAFKNTNRFEWFLEKATEIGVGEIIPLICERTEKEKIPDGPVAGICISAMLQSQQTWLPVLREPVKYENMEVWKCGNGINYIAHCIDGNKQELAHQHISTSAHSLICIGPEGDFTPGEIELALGHQFVPVSLGNTRLRTETAGVVAATLLCLGK